MAGREALRAEAPRVVERDAELDLAVAQHVGVGSAAGAMLAQKMTEYPLAVLGREAHAVQRDAETLGHQARVLKVLRGRAPDVVVVLFPVAHEQAVHVPALFL